MLTRSTDAATATALTVVMSMVEVFETRAGRFSPDEHRPGLVAFAITSVAASIAVVQLAVLWFNMAEMLRIGNDHLGQTRAFPTSGPYLFAMFGAGVLLFSVAALRQYRGRAPQPQTTNEHLLR